MLSTWCNSGCNNSKYDHSIESDTESLDFGYQDGTYCAEIEYYNPSTGTRNSYNLDVEVENGELTLIHWPNNGWLDDSHFSPTDITSGECGFISDRGNTYAVVLNELGGCGYTDETRLSRDLQNDIEAATCPECGDEKEKYDDYCYSCNRKKVDERDNTCSRCGDLEYGVYGGLCTKCKSEDENE